MSRKIVVFFVLCHGMAFSELSTRENFSFWTCVSSRAVKIKLKELDGWCEQKPMAYFPLNPLDSSQCVQKCDSFGFDYALFSILSVPKCVCIRHCEESRLTIHPADISQNCQADDASEECPYGTAASYSLFCSQGKPCDVLQGDMKDPSWFGANTSQFEPWMNYFPKCVLDIYVDETKLIPGASLDVPEEHARQQNYDYILLKTTENNEYEYSYAQDSSAFHFSQNHSTIPTDNRLCAKCPGARNSQTCGGAESYSIYCQADYCKVKETNWKFFHYFGCSSQSHFPILANSSFYANLDSMENCFSSCHKANMDTDVIVTTVFRGKIQCHCYQYNINHQDINITMDTMAQGCEKDWDPPLGSPVGHIDRFQNQWFSIHCETPVCEELLGGHFVSPITEYPCSNLPITTTLSTTSVPIFSTTITTTQSTASTSIMSSPTSTTSETPNTADCEFCVGRKDERGFYWNSICAEHSWTLSTHCPSATVGEAIWTCDPVSLQFVPPQPDRTGCISPWIADVEDMTDTEGEDPKNITRTILSHISNYTIRSEQITSGTLIRLIAVGEKLPYRMNDSVNGPFYSQNFTATQDVVLDYLEITADLFHNDLAWREDADMYIEKNATTLISTTEAMGFVLLKVAEVLDMELSDNILTDSRKEVIMQADICQALNMTVNKMPTPSYVTIQDAFEVNGRWKSVGVAYEQRMIAESTMFGPTQNDLGLGNSSNAHSLVFNGENSINGFTALIDEENISGSVDIMLTFEPSNQSSTYLSAKKYCVFWDEEECMWSSRGCWLEPPYDIFSTHCKCNHTTNFAVLFDVNGDLEGLSENSLRALEIMSYILCGASSVCCLLTFFILQFSKLPPSPRTEIQANRAITLFCLYFFFLIGVDPDVLGIEPNSEACRFFAILVHFFGLSSFFWTGIEGHQLYKALVHRTLSDDDGKYSKMKRYLIGYGVPLVIVSATLAADVILDGTDGYNNDISEICWLEQSSFIWAFIGPAAVIIFFNFFILIRAYRVAVLARRKMPGTFRDKLQANIKSFIILNFLLGITWSCGLMIRGEMAKAMAYLFVTLNGSVGIFIFIHTILLNETIMSELKVRLHIVDKGQIGLNLGGDRSRAVNKTVSTSSHIPVKHTSSVPQRRGKEYHQSSNLDSSPATSSPSVTSVSTIESSDLPRQQNSSQVPLNYKLPIQNRTHLELKNRRRTYSLQDPPSTTNRYDLYSPS